MVNHTRAYPIVWGDRISIIVNSNGIFPHVKVCVGFLPLHGLLEPFMKVARVVGNKVEHNLETLIVGSGEKVLEIIKGAKDGINVPEVRDVVTEIFHGALVNGRQPNRLNSEVNQVVKLGFNSLGKELS